MAILKFKTLEFVDKKDFIRVRFLKIYYFDLEKEELEKISKFVIRKHSIEFKKANYTAADRRFGYLLEIGFSNLRNSLTKNKTVYIHQNSGIPLIGSNAFGIIYRDTNMIEIRPNTGCNLDCIYCSVDEGASSKKKLDFVVEKDYLVDELINLIDTLELEDVYIHIGTQGEPLLYADLVELVKDLSKIKEINNISLSTNGIMLTKELADKLIKAGLTQFNLSINAVDAKVGAKLAGCAYDIEPILNIATYISKESKLIITPVWVPGFNDAEIEKLVVLSKKLKCKMGIQNFLNYKSGRNPAKQMDFEIFYRNLKELEEKHKVELIIPHTLINTPKLEKPFKKGDVVQAEIKCPGRTKDEKIAVAEDRAITVNTSKDKGKIKLKITRSKHNVFYGVVG